MHTVARSVVRMGDRRRRNHSRAADGDCQLLRRDCERRPASVLERLGNRLRSQLARRDDAEKRNIHSIISLPYLWCLFNLWPLRRCGRSSPISSRPSFTELCSSNSAPRFSMLISGSTAIYDQQSPLKTFRR